MECLSKCMLVNSITNSAVSVHNFHWIIRRFFWNCNDLPSNDLPTVKKTIYLRRYADHGLELKYSLNNTLLQHQTSTAWIVKSNIIKSDCFVWNMSLWIMIFICKHYQSGDRDFMKHICSHSPLFVTTKVHHDRWVMSTKTGMRHI